MTGWLPAVDSKALTIRDIARLAGVSHSTVSLVLNDNARISDETRQKVRRVMEQVGYAPNVMARSLVRKTAAMIAVVLPHTSSHTFSDSYFSEAVSGIAEALESRSRRMLVEFCNERFVAERRHLKLFRQRQIDGMLVLGTLTTDTSAPEVHAARFPIMVVNSDLGEVPCVLADNAPGVRQALQHLSDLGHRRIAHVGGLTVTTVGQQRLDAYRAGMLERGLDPEEFLAWGDFSEESGRCAAVELLARPAVPTAILAGNDLMAIGILRHLQKAGVRVPEDVSVIGADDIGLSQYVTPRLTTIRQPMYRIGQLATNLLLDRLENGGSASRTVVATEFVRRDSTGPARA